jgi:Fe2+ transport system protein B
MKKEFILVLILIFFSSCLGSKKVIENNTSKKSIEKLEVRKDSSNIVEKNKSISDKLDLIVTSSKTDDKNFNKKVDSKVDEILAKLNTSKKSGDNSYKLYYNLLKRQVEFEAKIGETKNENTVTNTEEKTEKTTEEIIDTYIYKRVTTMPWYLWIVIYFMLFDGKIASLLSNFVPQLRGATSIFSIFKKKNDN